MEPRLRRSVSLLVVACLWLLAFASTSHGQKLTGYEELAQCLDTAYLVAGITGSVDKLITKVRNMTSDDYLVRYQDCYGIEDTNITLYWPEPTPGGALDIALTSGTIRLGALPVDGQISDGIKMFSDRITAIIAAHYGIKSLKLNMTRYTDVDSLLHDIDERVIYGSMPMFSLGTVASQQRISTLYRTCCSYITGHTYAFSPKQYNITSVDALRKALSSTPGSTLAAVLIGTHQVVQANFPTTLVWLFNNVSTAVEAMLQPDARILAVSGESWEFFHNPDWDGYPLDFYSPTVIIVPKETRIEDKVAVGGTIENWQQGNEDLANVYDAAVLNMFQWNYFQQHFGSLTSVRIADCVNGDGFSFQQPREGVLATVYTTGIIRVGVSRREEGILLTAVSQNNISGLIVDAEQQICASISVNLGKFINPQYFYYETDELLLEALATGEIDHTLPVVFEGGVISNGTLKRWVYRSSCISFSDFSYILARTPLATVSELPITSSSKTGGVLSRSCNALKIVYQIRCTHEYDTMDEGLAALRGGIIDYLVADAWLIRQANVTGLYNTSTTVMAPRVSFFRKDKVYACGDDIYDASLGEECEVKGFGCSQTCSCMEGFRVIGNYSCEEVNDDGPSIVGIVVGVCLGSVALILGALVGTILVVRHMNKQTQLEAAISLEQRQFLKREKKEAEEFFDASKSTLVENPDDFMLGLSISEFTFGGSSLKAVDTKLEEVFQITNETKNTIYWSFYCPQSHKFALQMEPQSGSLDPMTEWDITCTAMVYCTTSVQTHLAIVAGTKHNKEQQRFNIPLNLKTMNSNKLDPDELETDKQIGEGTFGIVFKGTWRGAEVAIKVLKNQDQTYTKQNKEDFEREVQMMVSLKHPQIVTFYGAVFVQGSLAIVTEFMPYGNLQSLMKDTSNPLSFKLKCKFILDCSKAMDFLHHSNVIHRDLKLENLLVASLDASAFVCAKITDFGTTKAVQDSHTSQHMTKAIGTPIYMAPEVFEKSLYSTKTDVFSFAIMCWILFTGQEPYTEFGDSIWKIGDFLLKGERLPIPADLNPKIADLIKICWDQDSNNRPDFSSIIVMVQELSVKKHHHKH
ncbi:tyrosine protein kinase [Pelomyxa schiedti]|nr:tyrosine protein kinase [Pelomyxa schiedti]